MVWWDRGLLHMKIPEEAERALGSSEDLKSSLGSVSWLLRLCIRPHPFLGLRLLHWEARG